MRSGLCMLILLASGCAYVTKSEFDTYWDADGDGWPLDEDCNDANADIFPFAADVRGDGCDSDCGMEEDADGDDWPDRADCGPEDPDIHPCSDAEVPGDQIDSDCDGFDDIREDSCPGIDPDFPDAGPVSAEDCGAGGSS